MYWISPFNAMPLNVIKEMATVGKHTAIRSWIRKNSVRSEFLRIQLR
jgi:hypothetical protein